MDPKDPDAKVKFLAAEALRGVGGLLINRDGERFVDELEHRDYVTGKMWENDKVGFFPSSPKYWPFDLNLTLFTLVPSPPCAE